MHICKHGDHLNMQNCPFCNGEIEILKTKIIIYALGNYQDLHKFALIKYCKNCNRKIILKIYDECDNIENLKVCPVCGQVMPYNSYFKVYLCDCGYEEV